MTTPSQVPVRYPSGVSTDYSWGPLANYGDINPFFYQVIQDDMFGLPAADDPLTTVLSGTGAAIAAQAGDGGQWLFTTSTAGAGTSGIIGQKNNFFIPPALYTGSGSTATLYPSKKMFFLCRINVAAVASTTVYAGFFPQTTTTALPTDGIFFQLTSATSIVVTAYSASTLQWTITLPATTLFGGAYANGNWLDLGLYYDRSQNVYAFAGFPLVGWLPASAWVGSNANTATPGPLGAVAAYQTGVSGAWTPTTAGLTIGIIATGTIQTIQGDFIMGSKER
jgi:hypothetical protein